MLVASPIHQILDLARWAPSGDNTQPWRFEIVNERQMVVHGHDTRADCVYDLDGRPSQISLGALLETISIAASEHGWCATWTRRGNVPDTAPTFDVSFTPQSGLKADPLLMAVPLRSVQRKALQVRPLTLQHKAALELAVGPDYRLRFFGGWAARWRWARLLWRNAGLRLTLPEAFDVHRRIIQWDARYSTDRIPDRALGADPMTLALMRWAMSSWDRVNFLNTWLGGTIAPRLVMDLLPAMACAAHVAIVARCPPTTVDDYITTGRAVQRFWLTATTLGLQHQPEVTPLIFRRYAREGTPFTASRSLPTKAAVLANELDRLLGDDAGQTVWLGRVGYGELPRSRSVRMARGELDAR